jgi:hypothetical protein
MRWIMLGLTILGFVLTFTAKSSGVLAIGLVSGFIGSFGLLFSLASDRVSASSRPDSAILGPEDIAALRARNTAAKPRPVAAVPSPKPAAVPPRPVAVPPKAPPPAA